MGSPSASSLARHPRTLIRLRRCVVVPAVFDVCFQQARAKAQVGKPQWGALILGSAAGDSASDRAVVGSKMRLSGYAAAVERFDGLIELLDAEVYGHLAQRLWPLMVRNRFDHV